MGIGNINKNNFDLYNKIMQIGDTNKKHAWQDKLSHGSVSQKADNIINDYVEFSNDGKQRAGEVKNGMGEMAGIYQDLMRQLESSREQSEAMEESSKVRMKCLLIAMRIMSGDKVPNEDYRYLAKHDLELYAKAVSMRVEKENPKKHKRLSEDERVSEDEKSGGGGEESDSAGIDSIQSGSDEVQAETNTDSQET